MGFIKRMERAIGPRVSAPRPVATPVNPRPVATPADIILPRKMQTHEQEKDWQKKQGHYGTSEGAVPLPEAPHRPTSAFLAGTLANVTSSVIAWGKYDHARAELTLGFLPSTGLTTTVYEGITAEEAAGFYAAGSKGGWWHDVCLGRGWKPGGGTAKAWRFA